MDENLIEQVRRHEVLYNCKLTSYRDQNIRQEAWEEIGRELQMPGNQAKLRWESLRRCFSNARNRQRYVTKKDSARKCRWKYEQQMSFILPFFGSLKKTPGKVNNSQSSYNELAAESDDMAEDIKEKYYEDIQDDQEALDDNASDAADLDTNTEINYKHHKAVQFLKKQYGTSTGLLSEILKKYSKRKHQYEEKKTPQTEYKSTNILENLDDTDLFFLSMSKMTKQMPKVEQSQIKLALSNFVLSAEVRCNQSALASV